MIPFSYSFFDNKSFFEINMQISKQISKHYFLIIKFYVNKYKKSMLHLLFCKKFKNELATKTTLNWSQDCICIYLYSISSAVW